MVDTLTTYKEFKNFEDYRTAKEIFSDYIRVFNPKQPLHWNGNKYTSNALASFGMEEISFTQKKTFKIFIKLRPKLMIEKGNYNNVLRMRDVPQLYKAFKTHIMNIGLPLLSDLAEWKVKRIDYAIDIIVNPHLISRYIELFKQGNITEALRNSDVSKRYEYAKNNLYLSGKNYRVNFYDRHTTVRLKEKNREKTYLDTESLNGVMRFEIQVRKINATKLRKSGLITKNCVGDFLNIELCKYYISKYYIQIVGLGDYYTLTEAMAKCKSDTQRSMLCLVKEEGSISEAKKIFIENSSNKRKTEKRFSERIKKLHANGINPVTIDFGVVENLYSKIMYQIEGSNQILIKRRKINYEAAS